MNDRHPTFPPLLSGHELTTGNDPFVYACADAAKGAVGAGELFWSKERESLRFALVLEPDVPRARCGEMVYAAMVAFGDAAGALIPPEVAITYQWPNVIQMNNGQIGSVDLQVSQNEESEEPAWMVLGLNARLMPDFADMNPGENYHVTTFWDEGCGNITRTGLLESVARHLVNAIHTWSEGGFKPIHRQWLSRLNSNAQLSPELARPDTKFVGLDELGSGLLSVGGEMISRSVVDVLDTTWRTPAPQTVGDQ
ncbi:MAG: biotin/lipoate--protein ligase family protein [Rhizobiaceae bacterium]